MKFRFALCVVFGSTLSQPALAEAPTDDSVKRAAQHYSKGYDLAAAGNFQAAIEEFEQAYQASPHYAVLYNLGLAYSMSGRPVEAVTTLRRFISEGGAKIEPSLRKEATAAIDINERRIGRLKLIVRPNVSVPVVIDGKSYEPAAVQNELSLIAGSHGLWLAAPDYRPEHVSFKITPQQLTKIELRLEPARQSTPNAPSLLKVSCAVPNAQLSVDGKQAQAVNAKASLTLPSGQHRLEFSRDGYQKHQIELTLSGGAHSDVDCELRPLAKLPPNRSARIAISAAPGSVVRVDGAAYRGELIPLGDHELEVTKTDYLPHRRKVSLKSPGTERIDVELEPTPEHARELHEQGNTARTWSYILGGTGLALGAAATVLYLDADADHSAYKQLVKLDAKSVDAEEAARIQRNQDVSVGLAIAGGACLATAGFLFWRSLSANKESSSQVALTPNSIHWRTTW